MQYKLNFLLLSKHEIEIFVDQFSHPVSFTYMPYITGRFSPIINTLTKWLSISVPASYFLVDVHSSSFQISAANCLRFILIYTLLIFIVIFTFLFVIFFILIAAIAWLYWH